MSTNFIVGVAEDTRISSKWVLDSNSCLFPIVLPAKFSPNHIVCMTIFLTVRHHWLSLVISSTYLAGQTMTHRRCRPFVVRFWWIDCITEHTHSYIAYGSINELISCSTRGSQRCVSPSSWQLKPVVTHSNLWHFSLSLSPLSLVGLCLSLERPSASGGSFRLARDATCKMLYFTNDLQL